MSGAKYTKSQMEQCARLILGSARMGKEPRAFDTIALAKMVLGIPGAIPKEETTSGSDDGQ